MNFSIGDYVEFNFTLYGDYYNPKESVFGKVIKRVEDKFVVVWEDFETSKEPVEFEKENQVFISERISEKDKKFLNDLEKLYSEYEEDYFL